MKRKIWFFTTTILMFIISNVCTYLGTSYQCSLKHENVFWLSKESNRAIFAFLIVPDNGQWNEETAKTWLKRPENTEWANEITDRSYVKWSPETVNHVAYGFRLEELSPNDSRNQLAWR